MRLAEHLAALDAAPRSGLVRESLHFALGKAFDDCGCYDEAFAHYAAGNAFLDGVGTILTDSARRRIEETKKSPSGNAWQAWSPAYQEHSKDKPHKGFLFRNGYLYGSIQHVVGDNFVEDGSNLEYARIHQEGGFAGAGKKAFIPARPYLGLGADDLEDVRSALVSYYEGKIGGDA